MWHKSLHHDKITLGPNDKKDRIRKARAKDAWFSLDNTAPMEAVHAVQANLQVVEKRKIRRSSFEDSNHLEKVLTKSLKPSWKGSENGVEVHAWVQGFRKVSFGQDGAQHGIFGQT
jgi:hypothetical protein